MIKKGNGKSLKEAIHDAEYHDILVGKYPINHIITERVLVEKYQVSKAPIREALVQLCSENMLKSIPRCGYQVVQITAREIEEGLSMRLLLELGALERTAKMITPSQLKELQANIDRSQEITENQDIFKHWFQNIGFHLLLCSLADNTLLYATLDQVLKYCSRGAYQYFNRTWAKDILTDASQHQLVVDHLSNGNLEEAKSALHEDILSMREAFQSS